MTGDGSLPHPAILQETAKQASLQGCLQEVFEPNAASQSAKNWVPPRTVFPARRNSLHPSGRCRLQLEFLQADLGLPQEPASRLTSFVIHPSPLALPPRVWAGDESPAVLALDAPLFSSYLKCKSLLQALPSCASVFGRDVLASVVSPPPLEPRLILPKGSQLICCPVRHQLLPERSPECSHKASRSLFTPRPHNTLAT